MVRRMNQSIFNSSKQPLYVESQKNATYQDKVVEGEAYYLEVKPSYAILLVGTIYYAVQLSNPSGSGKSLLLEGIWVKRGLSGIGTIASNTHIYIYNGGALAAPISPVTIMKANPSSTHTTVASAMETDLGIIYPFSTVGTKIEEMTLEEDNKIYYYRYNGGIYLPANTSLVVLAVVNIVSISLPKTVLFDIVVKYWEEEKYE